MAQASCLCQTGYDMDHRQGCRYHPAPALHGFETVSIDNYLDSVGGLTPFADPDEIYVVKPMGMTFPKKKAYRSV